MTSKLPLLLLVLLCWAMPLHARQNSCLPAVPTATSGPTSSAKSRKFSSAKPSAQAMQKNYAIIEGKALIAYLNALGERLMKHLPLKQRLQVARS